MPPVKRELALAVVVGTLAGLAGAWSARRDTASIAPPVAPVAAALDAEADQPVRGALSGRVAPAAKHTALLRVQVRPPRAVPLRLSRWSTLAGRGGEGEWRALPPATTDATGAAQLALDPGTYFVAATTASAQIELTTVADLELELEPGVAFSGRVLEKGTERPIARALVIAARDEQVPESEQLTVETDGLGRFAFDALPKGPIDLQVSARGYTPDRTSARAPGSADVHLVASCRVDGVVVDGEGASVQGTRAMESGTIAGEGGRFWLELDCGGAQLIARDAKGRVGTAKVAAGQRTVTLRLEAGLNLPGTVTLSGAAIAGAEIAALTTSDEVRSRTVSDERGTFTLTGLTPGSYIIRARKGRGTSGALYGIEVPAREPVQVALEPGAALEGEVSGGDDPIEVTVSWSRLLDERDTKTRTLGGRYRFEDLPAGMVTVEARVKGRTAERRVLLTRGATQTVNLALEGLGRVVGRVTGAGTDHARVHAFRHLNGADESSSTTAEPDGTYALELHAGEWKLDAFDGTFWAPGIGPSVKVVVGEDTHHDLALQRNDSGNGWGPMASVAHGEVGASFENVGGSGVQVSWVITDSPMSSAGLKVGDLVTAIDGKAVVDALDAFSRTRGEGGAAVAITYRREGVERTVKVARAP